MSRLAAFHRRLVFQGPGNLLEFLLFWFLVPLSWIYGGIGRVRIRLYRWGIFPAYRAAVPVISVGNLSVGGTGKTPVVDHVLRFFLSRGKKVAVVSRGYGVNIKDRIEVSLGEGPLLSPGECGDEPYLLARRNPGALVIVSPRRARGVRRAEELGAELILLDDGFQHRGVCRDLDIVLLDARAPLGNGNPLPAGVLREFPTALSRGDLFIFTRCGEKSPPSLSLPGPVLHCRHRLDRVAISLNGDGFPLEDLAQKNGVAFAGLADPEAFFSDLTAAGLHLEKTLAFPDHARYGPGDLARIAEASREVDFLVTSEKDGVKLQGVTFPVPCYQVPMALEFAEKGELETRLRTFAA